MHPVWASPYRYASFPLGCDIRGEKLPAYHPLQWALGGNRTQLQKRGRAQELGEELPGVEQLGANVPGVEQPATMLQGVEPLIANRQPAGRRCHRARGSREGAKSCQTQMLKKTLNRLTQLSLEENMLRHVEQIKLVCFIFSKFVN